MNVKEFFKPNAWKIIIALILSVIFIFIIIQNYLNAKNNCLQIYRSCGGIPNLFDSEGNAIKNSFGQFSGSSKSIPLSACESACTISEYYMKSLLSVFLKILLPIAISYILVCTLLWISALLK